MNNKFKIFDSDSLKNIHKRVFFSIAIFTFVFVIVLGRITDVMIITKTVEKEKIIKKNYERGNIFDRNGVLLASSIKNYSLGANPNEIQDGHCSYTISLILEKILSIPKININLKLLNNSKFVYLKRNISPREHQKIINLGEIGLKTRIENKRIYPLGEITSHVVGFTDIDNYGRSGIEKGLEKDLSVGKNIYLSIDSRLQESIRSQLEKAINRFSADSGSVIILDVHSGEILSMNSYPDFNPNDKNTLISENLFNGSIQGNYEMGSTFKPLTVAMGIDDNHIEPHSIFDVSKPMQVGKYIIKDHEPFNGELNTKEIIVKSSNIGISKIADKIGKINQQNFFKKIGFYKKIELEIDETAIPLTNKNNWGRLETMTIAYGHGFAITPLHLANAYASLVNGGFKINPSLIRGENRSLLKEKILKNSTSIYVRELLNAVITETNYTGPRVKIEGYEIGGKTGTAELIDKTGRYLDDANRTTFASVFPISNPKYALIAIINNPKKIKEENYSITSATVVAPLIKEIIISMIKILGIPPNLKNETLKASIQNQSLKTPNVIN